MGIEELNCRKYITIAECEICSNLAEDETSFFKYSWDDLTRPLPREAAQLEPAEAIDTYKKEKRHVKRCPICGTFYLYSWSYEYLANGSEDEEELTRLTPTQARRFLTDAEYDFLIATMTKCLRDPNATTRHYAAKCLVSHHLERNESTLIREYLTYPDPEVAKGALLFLSKLAGYNYKLQEISKLKKVLKEISNSAEKDVATSARYILRQIIVYEEHLGHKKTKRKE